MKHPYAHVRPAGVQAPRSFSRFPQPLWWKTRFPGGENLGQRRVLARAGGKFPGYVASKFQHVNTYSELFISGKSY